MRHFRYSLEATNSGAMAQLKGNPIETEQELREAYKISCFHYQFQDGKISRIMRCSTVTELEFVIGQLKNGSFIVIQRGDSRPRI